MRGTPLARAHMMLELGRLMRVHKRPAWAPENTEAFAGDYIAICDDVSAEQMTQAVTAYLRSAARFFPKPGELRAIAREQPGLDMAGADPDTFDAWLSRGASDAAGGLTPCPVCGRAWQAHPRVTLVHNHAKHRAARVRCLDSCDEMGCIGTYGVPPQSAPVAVSEGELWAPPENWSSSLRDMQARRDAIHARVERAGA